MSTNSTFDSSRNLRHTRLILLSTLLILGLTGCSLVVIWLIRYIRFNMRSTRICSLILNLIVANLSVYIFATGIQIYWEFQTNRQWPFNDLLCRIVKFFQSFSILSSTYIIVAMAIDRCIAIVTPLRAGKIRVLYLCGSAWTLAGLLSTPNIFIFNLHVNGSVRYCTAVFNRQSSPTGRRIYLTFITLVVYFIPFLVLVLCYTFIFIKLLCREYYQGDWLIKQSSTTSYCCSWLCKKKMTTYPKRILYKTDGSSSANDLELQRKRVNTYAKARSKTFRMIIVLVLFMIIFGAPYYCLELYIAYTNRKPSDLILALAGGAAVAPSSLDPWIFLLFWINWGESKNHLTNSQQLVKLSLHRQNTFIQSRRMNRSHILSTSDPYQHHILVPNTIHLSPHNGKSDRSSRKLQIL